MWDLPADFAGGSALTSFHAVALILFFGSFVVFLVCAFWRSK